MESVKSNPVGNLQEYVLSVLKTGNIGSIIRYAFEGEAIGFSCYVKINEKIHGRSDWVHQNWGETKQQAKEAAAADLLKSLKDAECPLGCQECSPSNESILDHLHALAIIIKK